MRQRRRIAAPADNASEPRRGEGGGVAKRRPAKGEIGGQRARHGAEREAVMLMPEVGKDFRQSGERANHRTKVRQGGAGDEPWLVDAFAKREEGARLWLQGVELDRRGLGVAAGELGARGDTNAGAHRRKHHPRRLVDQPAKARIARGRQWR